MLLNANTSCHSHALSGCFRLPSSGPFSNNTIAMKQVHLAMQTLGFKPKDLIFIFMLLSAILQLSNIQFVKADVGMCQHWVVNVHMLEQVAQLLGMSPDKLAQTLTNQKLCPPGDIHCFFWILNRVWCNETNLCRICMPFYSSSLRSSTIRFVLPLLERHSCYSNYYTWLAACVSDLWINHNQVNDAHRSHTSCFCVQTKYIWWVYYQLCWQAHAVIYYPLAYIQQCWVWWSYD